MPLACADARLGNFAGGHALFGNAHSVVVATADAVAGCDEKPFLGLDTVPADAFAVKEKPADIVLRGSVAAFRQGQPRCKSRRYKRFLHARNRPGPEPVP